MRTLLERRVAVATLAGICVIACEGYASPISHATHAPLAPNQQQRSGEVFIGGTGDFTSTSANFNSSATSASLPASGSFQSIEGTMTLGWGISDLVTVFGDFTGARNDVSNSAFIHSNSGIKDLEGGFRISPEGKKLRWSLEVGGLLPFYNRMPPQEWARYDANTTVPLGNGTKEFWGMIGADIRLTSEMSLGMTAGARNRSDGFSNPFESSLYLAYEDPHTLFVRAGLRVSVPLQRDGFEILRYVPERSSAALAGSQIYNSIDPAKYQFDSAIGVWLAHPFYVAAGLQADIYGRSTSQGFTALLTAGLTLGGPPAPAYSVKRHESSGDEFTQSITLGHVTKVNLKVGQFLVDQGRDNVKVGDVVDVYVESADATNGLLCARARALEVGPTTSKFKILSQYGQTPLKEGFVVKTRVD